MAELPPAKRQASVNASCQWAQLAVGKRAEKLPCTALVVASESLSTTGPTSVSAQLIEVAHAALSLQVAFANRPSTASAEGRQTKQFASLDGKHYRRYRSSQRNEQRKTVRQADVEKGSHQLPSDVHGTLDHALALAQAVGSPIDEKPMEEQLAIQQGLFNDVDVAGSLARTGGDLIVAADLPCHCCGNALHLADCSLACVSCGGQDIHDYCLPAGDTRHQCLWCIRDATTRQDKDSSDKHQQPSASSEEPKHSPSNALAMLLAVWCAATSER